uniref:Junctional adhesion molecule 2 n=1 Tax=Anas platyrhynchos platyrhynchos TaxID=8840 RepID=A0A493TDV5_ANAPP
MEHYLGSCKILNVEYQASFLHFGVWSSLVEVLIQQTLSGFRSTCMFLDPLNSPATPAWTLGFLLDSSPSLRFAKAILSCKHKFSKGVSLRIEWKKIQSQGVSFVYYNGDFTGDLKDRAEMLNTGIRIRNVTRKDSGTYRCEISAKSEEGQRLGEATITLTVLVPPTTPVCEVPSSAMTGTVVELSCKETEGSPPSEYQWYKNGVPLLEKTGTGSARAANVTYTMNKKSGTLLFNTVTKNDTGEYFCEASNGIGLPQKCSVRRMQVGMCQSNWNCNWNDFIA